jgi:hypothetical protein
MKCKCKINVKECVEIRQPNTIIMPSISAQFCAKKNSVRIFIIYEESNAEYIANSANCSEFRTLFSINAHCSEFRKIPQSNSWTVARQNIFAM